MSVSGKVLCTYLNFSILLFLLQIIVILCRFWKSYERDMNGCRIKKALLAVVRRPLTPPPTSTQTERLFSTAGNIVDGRPRLLPETLERLLFLRENLIMQNIGLNW